MSLPRPAVGDVVQVRIQGLLNAQVCMNTFLFTVTTGAGTTGYPDILQCTQKIGDWLWDDGANGLKLAITQDVTNVSYAGQIVHPSRTVQVLTFPTVDGLGTLAPPTVPTGVAAVVRRKGNVANRHNQGRVYIFGLPQGDLDHSTWSGGTPTLLGNWIQNQLNATIDVPAGANHTIFAPILAPSPAYTPIVLTQTGSFDDIVRYQRRREVGRGI